MAESQFLKYVDEHVDEYIARLSKAVAIPSCVPGASCHVLQADADTASPAISSEPCAACTSIG